jgi:hypothetical protein
VTDQRPPDIPQPWQPRFTIGTLLLAMLIFSVMAAQASYLVRSQQGGSRALQIGSLLFIYVAPLLLALVVSLVRQAPRWLHRPPPAEDTQTREP